MAQTTGAGCLLIYERFGTYRCLLVRNRRNGVYEDMGGRVDFGFTPEQTAQKELEEESLMVFTTQLEKKCFVQLHSGYRCYPIDITSEFQSTLFSKTFELNKNKLSSYRHSHASWNETDNITSFDLFKCISFFEEQSKSNKNLGFFNYFDEKGNTFKISTRPIKCFSLALKMKCLSNICNLLETTSEKDGKQLSTFFIC